jgi:hypothetical protein
MIGYIYIIQSLCKKNVYIGSTIQNISIRYCKHIYDSKYEDRIKPFHRFVNETGGFINYKIRLLKEVEINTRCDLLAYEKIYIEKYRNDPQYNILNTYF